MLHSLTHRFSHRHGDPAGDALRAGGGRCMIKGRKGRRILIVEDHFALRQHLLVLLQALEPDCQVVDTGTLSDARRLLATTPVDGLLVDVRLPDGSGLDFATEFRAANPDTPIVVMSAFDATELRKRVDRVTNAAFIRKFEVGDRWRTLLVDLLNRRLPEAASPQ
jgi:two-component system NtrC family response regulator